LTDGAHSLKVRQTDTAGNTGTFSTAEWTVDTTPPAAPTLNSTPAPLTRETTAGFGFAGEPGGTFQCRLDDAVFADCTNPASYQDLAPGDHTFRVRQTDAAGNIGPSTPFNWTIDRTPPGEPTIAAAPSDPTNETTAQFSFTGESGGHFECSRDGAAFAECQSPIDYDSLSETSHTFSVRQIDDAQNVGSSATHVWTVDITPPGAPTITSSPNSPTTEPDAEVAFSGEAGGSFECSLDGANASSCVSPQTFTGLATGSHSFVVRQRDLAGNLSAPSEATWSVATYDQPDPLPTTDTTSLMDQVDFLYAGANPIQTGVQPGTIEPVHVSVLRGSIKTRDGVPIPGVDVSVLDRPEFGHTITTETGEYSMAVNGGGTLTVKYEKSGYLPVERELSPNWLDYEVADEAVLTALDASATTVDSSGLDPMPQTVTSSRVTDDAGPRQAVLIIPPNTSAIRRLPDGTTQPLTQLTIRQTEFTVGSNGEQAMPADLPGTSAYTYAMAITIDGLTPEQASQVEFSKPVASYVNAVTDMPVGSKVPVGELNYATGTWAPRTSGTTYKVRPAQAASAAVAYSASGDDSAPAQPVAVEFEYNENGDVLTPEQLALLGIGAEEMTAIGAAYGDNSINGEVPITRVPLQRAGGVDYNGMKNVKGSAGPDPSDDDPKPDCDQETPGSIIECESQGLGEELPIAGTPYKLTYRSRRTAGRTAANTVTFKVTGPSVQSNLQRVLVKATVAGRVFQDLLPAIPNQNYTFTWDGKDAYGRELIGTVPLDFETGFVYPTRLPPVNEEPAFGRYPIGPEYQGVELTSGRREAVIWRGTRSTVGTWRAKNNGLGGWSLDVQHRYDPVAHTLIRGDGEQYSANDVNGVAKTTVANCPYQCPVGNPLPLSAQSLIGGSVPAMAVTSDGSIFASGVANGDVEFLKRVKPSGDVETIQDRLGPLSYQYPGGQSEATVRKFTDIAEAPDGSLYFIGQNLSRNRSRIGRVRPGQPMEWVQPLWGTDPIADGGKLSTLAPFDAAELTGLDVGKDGSIYITTTPQSSNPQATSRVWRILPTGEIDPVVGNGQTGDSADSGLARNLKLNYPQDVAVSDDGDLYVADTGNLRVLHVSPDGVAERVMYTRAQAAWYHGVKKLALAPDGRLYAQLRDIPTVLARELNGTVTSVTPNVTASPAGAGQINGDGGPALQASYAHTTAIAVSPDGALQLGAGGGIRTVTAPLPSYTDQELVVPSPGGDELYIFNRNGRHLRTVDAKTNTTIRAFSYDANNLLSAVTDGDGNVTTIERDANGKPTAIQGPFGRRTTLLVDNSGDLRGFTQPSGREDRMNYLAGGLLSAMRFPAGGVSQFNYDSGGRLLRDENAEGGVKTLTRTDVTPGGLTANGLGEYDVTVATSLGLESTHKVRKQWGSSGAEVKRVITYRNGRAVTTVAKPDGSKSVDTASGIHADNQLAGDPRFGMGSPFSGSTSVRTPSGRQLNITKTRTVQMGSSGNKLDINSQTETTTVNGRASTDLWQKITAFSITAPSAIVPGSQPAPTARQTFTSTTGRIAKTEQDAQGRVLRATLGGGLASAGFVYDTRGRIIKAADGNRAWTVTYDAQGNVASATDPLGRATTYEYDADGRATAVIMPGARRTELAYDLNGNIQSVTPPSRPAHLFAFGATDYTTGVQSPQVGSENSTTTYDYDAEHKLTTLTRPDNQAIDLTYDSSNRLSQVTQPQGNNTFTYNTNGTLATAHSYDGATTAVTYDGPLPVSEQHTGLVAATTAQTYDNDFRLTAALLNGVGINYTYDQDSLLTGVGAMAISRNAANGLPTATSLGVTDQTITTNDHAEVQRVDSKVSGASIFDAQYTRDDLGRVTTKSETTPQGQTIWSYLYDQSGRLAQTTKDGQLFATYTYDLNGNPVATTDALGVVKLATTDARDRLTTYGPETFTYNPAGELTTRTNTQTNDTTHYHYNAAGQLTSATLPNATTVSYKLDTAGNRLQVLEDGVVTKRYVYAPESTSPVAEVDASGNT
ncbi:MAG: hypothetical protein JHC87_04460, partial [Thermoleophilaceae bacterium]|nr:hypothetical protein [Thermoleophilaceae bacterium]